MLEVKEIFQVVGALTILGAGCFYIYYQIMKNDGDPR